MAAPASMTAPSGAVAAAPARGAHDAASPADHPVHHGAPVASSAAGGPGALWVLLVVAVGLLVTLAVVTAPPGSALPRLAGGSFMVVGSWWGSRPAGRRAGLLMLAAGAAWLVALALGDPIVSSLFDGLSLALIAHLLLSFPGGRLRRRFDRGLATAGYAAALVYGSLGIEAGRASRTVEVLVTLGVAVLVCVGIAVLVRRWRHGTPLARRATGPVLLAGAAALVALVVSLLTKDRAVHLCFVITFAALPAAFVAGRLRTRLAAARLADLVRGLRPGVTVDELSQRLAVTLGDPAIRLERLDPGAGTTSSVTPSVAGSAGRPAGAGGQGPAASLVLRDPDAGVAVCLRHDPWWRDEPAQLDAIAGLVLLVLRGERLHAQLRARADELAVSRARVARAAHDERRRIERNLHDGAQQRLVSASMTLGRLAQRDLGADGDRLASETSALLVGALADLRDLANGLHPSTLVERGLQVAVTELVRQLPVQAHVRGDLRGRRLDGAGEATAWFVVNEALTNVVKHAGASRVDVGLELDGPVLEVVVRDDGTGGADVERGTGLRGLADRVAATGGTLDLDSPRGGPTSLRARIPCRSVAG